MHICITRPQWIKLTDDTTHQSVYKVHTALLVVHLIDCLLHSPSLVAVGLTLLCDIWPPIYWLASPFCDCSSKYRLRLPRSQWIMGLYDCWEFPLFFRGRWQSPCTAQTAGKCLSLGLCKETVKQSVSLGLLNEWPTSIMLINIHTVQGWAVFVHSAAMCYGVGNNSTSGQSPQYGCIRNGSHWFHWEV